jgi:hypothetical protein
MVWEVASKKEASEEFRAARRQIGGNPSVLISTMHRKSSQTDDVRMRRIQAVSAAVWFV